MKAREFLEFAVAAVVLLLLDSCGGNTPHQPATATPTVGSAGDELWIAQIELAQKIRSGVAPLMMPTPVILSGATLLTSCVWLPERFHASGAADEAGPIPGTGRSVLNVIDVSNRRERAALRDCH